eukprot:TRINITY_DN5128_c0_g1_i5.p1 TRINITY_DN5128_c0_g1~~TRINITY_DN5128_c0_g1_i5.p1  ORF type:complete len:225 (-),score=32.91 TRINITY_DN5128_c0_g1_i5:234-908(-)
MSIDRQIEKAVLQVCKIAEDQVDEELHRLERLEEDDIEQARQRRRKQLQIQDEQRTKWLMQGHGEYREVDEPQFFNCIKGEDRVIVNFYRNNKACQIMDKHLEQLAKVHIETKFAKINAEKCGYLISHLTPPSMEQNNQWILPTLALIRNSKVMDYVEGFTELGDKYDFPTKRLETLLASKKILFNYDDEYAENERHKIENEFSKNIRKGGFVKGEDDEDSDFD